MIRFLLLTKEFSLIVKVTHKRLHLLKTKLNFYWCNNLKTNNFAVKPENEPYLVFSQSPACLHQAM